MKKLVVGIAFFVGIFLLSNSVLAAPSCFLEGQALLTLIGDDQGGDLLGTIGQESISLHASFARLIGNLKGEPVDLNIQPFGSKDFQVFGWVHGEFISWYSINHDFNFFQTCIKSE